MLSILDLYKELSMEFSLTRFSGEITFFLDESCSTEIQVALLLPGLSEYVFSKEFHSLLSSLLVC